MRKVTLKGKWTALVLAAVLFMASAVPAFAKDASAPVLSGDTVTKISNPDKGEGEVDGLIGDREEGYAWSIAERGDYLYIGTYRNTVGLVFYRYLETALINAGMTHEAVWQLIDLVTSGEVPEPTKNYGGYIVKMDKNDPGNFKIIFESEDAFRHVAVYNNDLYFATYTGATYNDSLIYKVDENDNVTEVYRTAQGASVRANCIYEDKLYFAGTYASEKMKEGEPIQLAVLEKHTEDDGWDLVADVDDFGDYAYDPSAASAAGSPFWDMTAFHGEIYATITCLNGYVVFKGHPAKEGETANKYGWVWTEVIGKNNGLNNQGLGPHADGFAGEPGAGYLSAVGAFGIYQDHLYVYEVDHTISAALVAASGMLQALGSEDHIYHATQYLGPLYACINNPQTLWRMDNKTGKFEEVKGFTELMKDTCNEYVWKSGVYNGEFYVSTMDSKVLYNYLVNFMNAGMFKIADDDTEGQKMWNEIAEIIENDVQGFDIVKTADGENWEVVTDSGFGDKYNYGGLRFVTTDQGMYITTANPFFGGQLYLLTNDKKTLDLGDINGDGKVNSSDARLALRAAAKLSALNETQTKCGDVNGDGKITSADARSILRASAKLEALPEITILVPAETK